MSEAAKSTWFWAKLLRPKTDEETCQLMLSPYRVPAWPTHCWMATPAKLDPVDCSDGTRRRGRRGAHEDGDRRRGARERPERSDAPPGTTLWIHERHRLSRTGH